jgi:thymidylate synthase
VSDIHDFRAEHFELSDYDPHPSIPGIPVAP